MTQQMTPVDADRAVKTRHRAMWASGDYPTLASDIIAELGETLVGACSIEPGDRVLDVAAGSGNAAIPAAVIGASVIASDLTPELFDRGRQRAAELGVDVEWVEADAEALPFDNAQFDVVMSSVGVMFAPHHQATADELVRVSKPGARIGLSNWTPDGFIGQMFQAMKPYAPAPPPGAQPGPLWGSEAHVRELFGDRVTDFVAHKRTVRIDRFATAEEFRDYFKAKYGPTIATYKFIADDHNKVVALDAALADLARRSNTDTGTGFAMDWEYLLVTARRS